MPDTARPADSPALDAFLDQVGRLRERLAAPLPGTAAQFSMAPAFRQDPSLASTKDKPCREAAVLALLFPHDGTPHLLLTVRRDDLPHHPGQISFPGGRRESGETLVETALREAEEEVGLPPPHVDVLGELSPLYIPPSNFCVHPFVGAATTLPPLSPQDAEVAAVLRVPLSVLLDPSTRQMAPWTLRGRTVDVPFFAVDSYTVWGATAMMLAELLAVLHDVTE